MKPGGERSGGPRSHRRWVPGKGRSKPNPNGSNQAPMFKRWVLTKHLLLKGRVQPDPLWLKGRGLTKPVLCEGVFKPTPPMDQTEPFCFEGRFKPNPLWFTGRFYQPPLVSKELNRFEPNLVGSFQIYPLSVGLANPPVQEIHENPRCFCMVFVPYWRTPTQTNPDRPRSS